MKHNKVLSAPLNHLEHARTRNAFPELLLFQAVVGQAIVDATQKKPSRKQRQARAIIFASTETTAEHWQGICDLAGISRSFVIRFTKDCIEAGIEVPRNAVSRALTLGYPDDQEE
jgi:hypothetical protein